MANPNRTVAEFRRKVGRDPKVTEAVMKRQLEGEFCQDMDKFQRGEMSAEEFKAKWQEKR